MLSDQHIEGFSDPVPDAIAVCCPLLENRPASAIKCVSGRVVGGAQLGRTIGFPTANMLLEAGVDLAPGIYAVHFVRETGERFFGVASFGRRPTVVENGELILETYVLDFSGSLYGECCTVELVRYLRPELRFDSIDAMVEQIRSDVVHARTILTAGQHAQVKLDGGSGA